MLRWPVKNAKQSDWRTLKCDTEVDVMLMDGKLEDHGPEDHLDRNFVRRLGPGGDCSVHVFPHLRIVCLFVDFWRIQPEQCQARGVAMQCRGIELPDANTSVTPSLSLSPTCDDSSAQAANKCQHFEQSATTTQKEIAHTHPGAHAAGDAGG